MPHGVLSSAQSTATEMVQVAEAPLAALPNCDDVTCGKGSPAPPAPAPVVALAGMLSGIAVVAIVAGPAGAASGPKSRRCRPAPRTRCCGHPSSPNSTHHLDAEDAPPARAGAAASIITRRPMRGLRGASEPASPGLGQFRRNEMSKSSNRRGPSARPTTTHSSRASRSDAQRRSTGASAVLERRQPAPGGLKRFRSRHPVLSALIPVALVLAIVLTMVIVKVDGGPVRVVGRGVAAVDRPNEHRGRPGNDRPGARRGRVARRAGGDARERRAALLGRRADEHRRQHDPPRRRRQADRHLRRRRVLPVLRGATLGHRGGVVTIRYVHGPVGHALVIERRLRRHADPVLLRIAVHEPVRRLPAGRGADEPGSERDVPDVAGTDGGAVQPAGALRLRRAASRSSISPTSTWLSGRATHRRSSPA